MGYFSLVAPWLVIVIYLLSFIFMAYAFQGLDFSKIIKRESRSLGIIIYLIFSVCAAFMVGSFILFIVAASSASLNGIS